MKNGPERICQGTAETVCSLKESELAAEDGNMGRSLTDKEPVPPHLSKANRAD